MKKKLLAVTLILMTVFLAGCGMSVSARGMYEHAHFCLGAGEYAAAQTYFAQLGEYLDAADCALYAGALQAWSDGDTALARRTLEALHPFKSSGRYLTYLDAMDAQEEGDLRKALTLYESLGTFGDSASVAGDLRTSLRKQEAQEARKAQEALEDVPEPTEMAGASPEPSADPSAEPSAEPSPVPVSIVDAMRAPLQTPAAQDP